MTRLASSHLLLLVVLPLTLVLSGCDSNGSSDEPKIQNEFSFTISPVSSSSSTAVPKRSQTTLEGFSFFVDTDDIQNVEEQAFAIYFNGNDSFSQQNATQGLFGFVGRESSQPGDGTYTLTDGAVDEPAPSEFVGFLYEALGTVGTSDSEPYYVFNSGTLRITASSDSRLAGEITGTATKVTVEGSGADLQVTEETVDITGEFTAENLDTYIPFNQYTSPTGI